MKGINVLYYVAGSGRSSITGPSFRILLDFRMQKKTFVCRLIWRSGEGMSKGC